MPRRRPEEPLSRRTTLGLVATATTILLVIAGLVVARGGGREPTTPQSESVPTIDVRSVTQARFAPVPGRPVFVAIIGNDSRPGETISRADALHLIGVNPSTGQATILNIPRDTYVDLPGGGRGKINEAHSRGGPVLQARALGQLVGVDVSFVVSTNFGGLVEMVDELGGVEVDVPLAMNDVFSRAVFPKGKVKMNGVQALAFSRNRHLDGGDFTRTQDQGVLILSALAKLRAEGTSPPNLIRWAAVLLRHSRFDGIGLADLFRMGQLASSVDSGRITNVTMPGNAGFAGAASVVFPGAGAAALFADFRDDAVIGAAGP